MSDLNVPRKWSVSRIASASLLILLVLAAIAYGIYSWVAGGSSTQTASTKTQQTSAPSPNANIDSNVKSSGQTNHKTSDKKGSTSKGSSSVSTKVGSVGANAAKSTGSTSSSSGSSTKQLSNTGPGDTAAIGFALASLLGAAFHYGWRRLHGERV